MRVEVTEITLFRTTGLMGGAKARRDHVRVRWRRRALRGPSSQGRSCSSVETSRENSSGATDGTDAEKLPLEIGRHRAGMGAGRARR